MPSTEFSPFLLVLEDACGSCFILFGLGQLCVSVPLDGMLYNGRSLLKVCLNLLTYFRYSPVVLTERDLGLNADRYEPRKDQTLDSAT